ncbi:Uncharacterised protein [Candidatus Tiddalikarchaeum anstoanum]|nr:Uncharacterised protein [Candidatus Tiddalikarchaeum anstoanum]
MFMQKDNFLIKCSDEDERLINSINLSKIYKDVTAFFDFKRKITIKIYFLESVDEFHFFSGYKFEKWMCSYTGIKNMITLFSPRAIEKYTIHKADEVPGVITHELAHIIYEQMGLRDIRLLNDGISNYLQFKDNSSKSKEHFNLSNIDFFSDSLNYYQDGPVVIKEIIEKFGKEKLFEFLEEAVDYPNEELNELFKKFFGDKTKKNTKK